MGCRHQLIDACVQAGQWLELCGAAVLCQPLSSPGTFQWHVTCPELWKYWFWDHMPEQVSIFLPSQTGSKLPWDPHWAGVCPGGCSKPFAAYSLQEVLSTSATTILQLWQHKPQCWAFLQAEVGLSVTKVTSASLLPAGSLHVNPLLLWEWWLKVASLRHGSLPSSAQGTREMEGLMGFEGWV